MRTTIFLMLASALAADQAGPSRDALLARDRALVAAFLENDADAVQDLYAPEAIVMPPNAPLIEGRDKILAWARGVSASLIRFSATPIRVDIERDQAWIAGTYSMTVRTDADQAMDDVGKYLEVWRFTGGRWRIVADMFNSDRPTAKSP
jgi:ketosteroid isomerase-like protein